MQIMKDPDGSVPDTVSTWLGSRRIRISEKVETICEPTGIGREISDGSPPGETGLSFANEPLILVCLVPKGILPEDFDIKSALFGSGITTSMALNIAEHKNRDKYELIAVQSCVELLSTRLQGFTLIADYNPLGPAVSLPGPGEVNPSFAKGPLILVCLVPKGILPEDFDIESALVGASITTSWAPNIAEHQNRDKYELAVVQSCVILLSTRLQGFELIADYNPLAPDDDVVCIHGIAEARKRARDTAFAIAKQAKREEWTPGSEALYREVFAKAGLEWEFDKEVLNRDIPGAGARALEESELDEGLIMALPKVRETDQAIAKSQLLNIDHQDIGPPQIQIFDEFAEWIAVDEKDIDSAQRGSKERFTRTLTYLMRAIRFSKQAKSDLKLALSGELDALNYICIKIRVDFGDLHNYFYERASHDGQAVDYTCVGASHDQKVEEFEEWIAIDEEFFKSLLTYLERAIRFGKLADAYLDMALSGDNMPSLIILNYIYKQIRVDFGDLLKDFYKLALKMAAKRRNMHASEQQEGSNKAGIP